jgi:hypothetical protein
MLVKGKSPAMLRHESLKDRLREARWTMYAKRFWLGLATTFVLMNGYFAVIGQSLLSVFAMAVCVYFMVKDVRAHQRSQAIVRQLRKEVAESAGAPLECMITPDMVLTARERLRLEGIPPCSCNIQDTLTSQIVALVDLMEQPLEVRNVLFAAALERGMDRLCRAHMHTSDCRK